MKLIGKIINGLKGSINFMDNIIFSINENEGYECSSIVHDTYV